MYILITLLLYLVAAKVMPAAAVWISRRRGKRLSRKSAILFDDKYMEIKAFYLHEFKQLPCVSFIGNLDSSAVFQYLEKGGAGRVVSIYQCNYFNWEDQKQVFDRTIFKVEDKVMIEVGRGYAEILYPNTSFDYAARLIGELIAFRLPEKEEDYEINIITLTNSGLELKPLKISPTDLDIELYYNDDFKETDKLIKKRLANENDKGIVLLHGQPGTGKTTYLRHLIGSLNKKVLLVSPAVAGNLMNPDFIDLLIDNQNCILVIEDAEQIIMDRKFSNNNSVSNLLNISDGLLSDCLSVQIICTFNSSLNVVDSALMRKGRLIARYEFGKLSVTKAQKLSDHLGLGTAITRPMTLAEITNPGEMDHPPEHVTVIGFRRVEELVEN